jgi:signal transducing adaptor molecule
MEAELFAKSASIDKLLTMMRQLSARGEDLADNDELAVSD